MTRKFKKYTSNLKADNNYIYSYDTKVAEITPEGILSYGWWSVTTSKHIRYAAEELGLNIVNK